MPTLRDILNPQGQPRVNVPFTRGGRTYRVVGLTCEGKVWTYTVEDMDALPKEYRFKYVTEDTLFGRKK